MTADPLEPIPYSREDSGILRVPAGGSVIDGMPYDATGNPYPQD
jgi:hypothetical protein